MAIKEVRTCDVCKAEMPALMPEVRLESDGMQYSFRPDVCAGCRETVTVARLVEMSEASKVAIRVRLSAEAAARDDGDATEDDVLDG